MASEIAIRSAQEAFRGAIEDPSLIDQHFAKIAFAVSTLALFILQPGSLILGTIAGVFLHSTFEPNPVIRESDKIISVFSATTAIVGAVAALIRLTPGGALGGYLFESLPFIFSMGIGSVAYCGYKYAIEPSR